MTAYHNVNNLRLEVEADVVGLPNLIKNPYGDLGAWAWVTPVTNTTMDGQGPDFTNYRGLAFYTGVTQAAYFTSEFLTVSAGKYVAARFGLHTISAAVKGRFEFYDTNKTLLSSSAQTGLLTGTSPSVMDTQYVPAVITPANTVYVKFRLDLYTAAGATPTSAQMVYIDGAMVTWANTNAFSTVRTNLIPNPSMEVDVSNWNKATNNVTMSRSTTTANTGTASMLIGTDSGGLLATNIWATDIGITGGRDYTFSFYVKAASTTRAIQAALNWRSSGGLDLGTINGTAVTDSAGAFTRVTVTGTAPSNAVYVRPTVVFPAAAQTSHYLDSFLLEAGTTAGTYFDGAFTSAGTKTYAWSGTANNSASTETNTSFAYSEPITWRNVLGPTHSIDIERHALDVGTLSATILDAMLDPAVSSTLAPGKAIRLMSLVNGVWDNVFQGRIDNARVSYDRNEDVVTSLAIKTSIFITATDNISILANQGESRGVAHMVDLAYLLEGRGVPWNMDYETGGVYSAAVVSVNDNASLLDQIALTRDSEPGYAWVDRYNVINGFVTTDLPDFGSQSVYGEDFETGVGGWAGTQSTIASNSTQFQSGTKSIAVTSTVANAARVESPYIPILALTTNTANVVTKAATIARTIQVGVDYYGANNVLLGSTSASLLNSTTVWTTHQVSLKAPLNTTKAKIWVNPLADAAGEVHYIDNTWMMGGPDVVFTDASPRSLVNDGYTSIDAGFNTDDVINQVIVNWLRTDTETGETSTIVYGPYSDAVSIATYGARQATFTIHGAAESSSAIATFANNVLAGSKTPIRKAQSLVLPVLDAYSLGHATTVDLYSLVGVKFSTIVNSAYRVTSIKHSISTDAWTVTYGFGIDTQVASPAVQPSPVNTDMTDGTWITPTMTNGWVNYTEATGYMRKNGIVYLRGNVRNGSAYATTAFTLPVGYRPGQDIRTSGGWNTANIYITADGRVQPYNGPGLGSEHSLDTIYFVAEN